jgi:dihydrofolate reductase
MNKNIILYIASSLDGFIAGKDHDLSWLFTDELYGWEEFEKRFDTAIMGRKTYEYSRQFSDPPFKGKRNFVVTSHKDLQGNSSEEITFCSLGEVKSYISEDIKQEGIFLVGGTELIADFINNDLLDEIIVSFHPVMLGEGIPLFEGVNKEVNLEFSGSEEYPSGLIKLKYKVVRE